MVNARVRGIFGGGSLCNVIESKSNQNKNASMTLDHEITSDVIYGQFFKTLLIYPYNARGTKDLILLPNNAKEIIASEKRKC